MRTIPIDVALSHPHLLGAALGGDASTWSVWLAVLRAAYGIPLSEADAAAFSRVSGGRAPPVERVDELWAVVGRRGGKSRMAAALAVYLATFPTHRLAPGENGIVPVIAPGTKQARIIFDYAIGFLEKSPVLRQEIASVTANEIRLRNGVVIAVYAGSFRTIRGFTLVGCVFDEAAFFRDETSVNADVETYRAVLPALATTKGMLIGISTPYRKMGLLYAKHAEHFGNDDPHVLVVAGPSLLFNPTLAAATVDRMRAADPEAALSEWEAEFRNDISSFLQDDLIDSAVNEDRPLELPPLPGRHRYVAFTDPSGGRHDAFTFCIGHGEGERLIIDVLRGRPPPFDPQSVTREYAELARAYGVTTITGDNYSAAWAETAWKAAGLRYARSEMSKSQLYLEGLPSFTRGKVELPPLAILLKELRLLERRTSRMGRDVVDHGRSGHDDYANALFGAIRLLAKPHRGIMTGHMTGPGGGAVIPYQPFPRQFSPPTHWLNDPQLMASSRPRN